LHCTEAASKKSKEREVEKFLCDALTSMENEPATSTWFALRLGPSTFGIFDTFSDNEGRQAHLSGKLAEALREKLHNCFHSPRQLRRQMFSR